MFPLCRPPISFFVFWALFVLNGFIYQACLHEWMIVSDGIWLAIMSLIVYYIIHQVEADWNKPFKKERRRAGHNKGCSRFYRRGKDRNRRNLECRIGIKHIPKALLPMVIEGAKHPRFFPELIIGLDDFPELRGSPRMPFNQSTPKTKTPNNYGRLVDCCFPVARSGMSTVRYDSDSFQIAIDNCATSCFTNDLEDFIDTPRATYTKILGIGQATSTFIGTVKWLIVDDNGRRHELIIPNTRYQQGLPFRLLCPQHVAQVYQDPKTSCLTLMDKVIFSWGQGKWQRTLPLHKSSNVGLMWSAPSNRKFYAFAAQFVEEPTDEVHIIPNDDEEEVTTVTTTGPWPSARVTEDLVSIPRSEIQREQPSFFSEPQRELPVLIDFGDEIEREPEQEPTDLTFRQAALRKCHS